MSKDKKNQTTGEDPADPNQDQITDQEESLELAVEILAEEVERLSKQVAAATIKLQEISKTVGSVEVVTNAPSGPIELPVYEIDGEKWKCKFPSFFVGKVKTTAEELVNDEATLRNLLAEKPNLFVKA